MTDNPTSPLGLKIITWENYGETLFTPDKNNQPKCAFSQTEKQILKVLLYKGSPSQEYRKKIWLIGSGAWREMKNNPKYYSNILQYSKEVPSPSQYQIELDLKRTFPDNPICMEDEFIQKLRNVLVCYSIRNSSIGYCQGMNFIVGRLLWLFDNEEEAFWMFTQIIEYLLPWNYYSEWAGVITDTTLMSIFIQKYLPNWAIFITNNQFDWTMSNFIHKWLVCLFTQNFDEEINKIIWDYFFIEGDIALTKACLGVFAILRPWLLGWKDFEDIYYVLNEKTATIKNPRTIIHFIAVRKFEFSSLTIKKFREKIKIPIIENLHKERIKRKMQSKSTSDIRKSLPLNTSNGGSWTKRKIKKQCNPKWPFCLADPNANGWIQVLILHSSRKPYVIENYYYEKMQCYDRHDYVDGYNLTHDKDVLMERKKHFCEDRKLVESSRIMLDESMKRSDSIDFVKEETEDNVELYEKILKGQHYENTKNWIWKHFNVKEIQSDELEYLYVNWDIPEGEHCSKNHNNNNNTTNATEGTVNNSTMVNNDIWSDVKWNTKDYNINNTTSSSSENRVDNSENDDDDNIVSMKLS